MLQLSLLGVGTVLRLGNDAWSMVKRLRQATNDCAPPRVEEEVDKQNCPCGKATESRTHIVAECEPYQEERDVLEGEMRDLDNSGMKSFDALDSREKTIAILGDRWWPQTAKQDGDKICRKFLCNVWKKRNEYLAVGGVSVRRRNGAPSRKGWVVNGQTT